MTQPSTQFTGDIPHHYDEGLGPQIFAPYAADIAQRAAAASPQSVLELAAGTGIVTRALRDRLPAATSLLASDLNGAMLQVAAQKFSPLEEVEFREADATNLPFADGSFDLAVCQFGVMFFPDKDRSYREVARVLRPGGRYLFNVWRAIDKNPFAQIAHETAAGFFKDSPPTFYQVPFGYDDPAAIEASLRSAGFGDVSKRELRLDVPILDARRFSEGLIRGNPLIGEIQSRGTTDPETVVAAVCEALMRTFGQRGRMPLEALVFEARKS